MNFGKALEALKEGKSVARQSWDERTLDLQEPGPNSKMTLPYIYETSGKGEVVPYTPSHQELLADDWMEA